MPQGGAKEGIMKTDYHEEQATFLKKTKDCFVIFLNMSCLTPEILFY